MSLLMDALKKAEETKRQAETGAFATAVNDSSAAASRKAAAASMPGQPSSLPALPSRLELLDDQFTTPRAAAAAKPSPDQAASAVAQEKDRQAAAQVFAAKTTTSRKSFHLVLGLSTAAAVLLIAGYFWWQLQPRSSLTAVTPSEHSTAPDILGNAASAPASGKTDTASSGRATAAPASSTKVAEATPLPPANESAPQAEQPAVPRERRSRTAVTEKGRLADAAPALATLTADSAIHITRSRLRVDPSVANGYRRFQSGDLAAAQQEYERALRSDPRNTDALDGLAAISLRRSRTADAAAYYQRALEADPMDATAQAGLINLRGSRDPRRTESRLKTLLAAQPDAHAAQFALGNLYAAQGHWREAQEAYFQAYSAIPDDPDYQFNLAVSLDQLHQPKPALQYYQSALAAAAARPAAFDQAQAAARMRELQP